MNWEQWAQAARRLLSLISLPEKELRQAQAALVRFPEQMKLLGFSHPSEVPSLVTTAHLRRRFGAVVAHLWRSWNHEPEAPGYGENAYAFRSLAEDLNALDFATSLRETEAFRHEPAHPLALLEHAFVETFFLCLERITRHNGPSLRYGLQEFHLELRLNDGMVIRKDVTLVCPLLERNKHSEFVVRRLAEGLPAEAPRPDASLHVFLHSIEDLRVLPSALHCRTSPHEQLFDAWSVSPNLETLCGVLEMRDGCKARLLSFGTSSAPQESCEEKPLGRALPGQQEKTFNVFRYLYGRRPLLVLQRPGPALALEELLTTLKLRPPLRLCFSESVENWDYFVLSARGGRGFASPVTLWLRAPRSDRHLPPSQRPFELAGVFDDETEPFPALLES